MSTIKTKVTDDSVDAYLASIDNEQKRKDCRALLQIFKTVTKEKPKVWSNNMIGFGSFHYKSARSRQEGDWPLTGFSARKANITVYIMCGFGKHKDLMQKIGKHKTGGSCLYINKIEDISVPVLKELIKKGYAYTKDLYAVK